MLIGTQNAPAAALESDKIEVAKLDHSKLLGFRILIDAKPAEGELGASADLVFQKRGTEGSGFA